MSSDRLLNYSPIVKAINLLDVFICLVRNDEIACLFLSSVIISKYVSDVQDFYRLDDLLRVIDEVMRYIGRSLKRLMQYNPDVTDKALWDTLWSTVCQVH